MKIALLFGNRFVLAAFSCMALSGCQRRSVAAEYWEMEKERIELNQALKLMEYRMHAVDSEMIEELNEVNVALAESELRLAGLSQEKTDLAAEVRELVARNETFKFQLIQLQRSNVMGREFDEFTLKDGRILRDVSIRGVDDVGVTVRHEHGAMRLSCSDLTREQQEFFGLDEGLALAAQNRERMETLATELWIDHELEMIRRDEDEASMRLAQVERMRPERSSPARNAAKGRGRALSQPATRIGERDGYRQTRFRVRRPTYRNVYYYSQPRHPARIVDAFSFGSTSRPRTPESSGGSCKPAEPPVSVLKTP